MVGLLVLLVGDAHVGLQVESEAVGAHFVVANLEELRQSLLAKVLSNKRGRAVNEILQVARVVLLGGGKLREAG